MKEHVALIDMGTLFGFGRITKEEHHRSGLYLIRLHEARIVNGKRCGYALQLFRESTDREGRIIRRVLRWERFLPTTKRDKADAIFACCGRKLRAKDDRRRERWQHVIREQEPAFDNGRMQEPQLRYLKKDFPETVNLLRQARAATDPSEKERLAMECWKAYRVETVALTGALEELRPATIDDVVEIAERRKALERRKPEDIEVFEMIRGWRAYAYMKPLHRVNAIRTALGHGPLSDATKAAERLRRAHERLKLPSVRKPGFK